MPEGCADGILKGMYRLRESANKNAKLRAQLFGSGAILNEALKAQKILGEKFGVAADVWSVTSYRELYRDGNAVERWNRLHPEEPPKIPYVTECLKDAPGVFVAASDYLKALPDSISSWFPRPLVVLGTDGFGRSESRDALRNFFEVDARHITLATLHALQGEGQIKAETVRKAIQELEINPEKLDPAIS
jgi:pyruvate dehydrogenase E1 component